MTVTIAGTEHIALHVAPEGRLTHSPSTMLYFGAHVLVLLSSKRSNNHNPKPRRAARCEHRHAQEAGHALNNFFSMPTFCLSGRAPVREARFGKSRSVAARVWSAMTVTIAGTEHIALHVAPEGRLTHSPSTMLYFGAHVLVLLSSKRSNNHNPKPRRAARCEHQPNFKLTDRT